MKRLNEAVVKFARDERGLVIVEFVLIFPLLIWSIVAMYSFWDVFRARNQFQKATHTVSNIISRTKKATELDSADVNGYHKLMNYLVLTDENVSMRVTQYKWYGPPTNAYLADWSCIRGSYFKAKITNADLALMKDTHLMLMGNGDGHILLETHMEYVAPFRVNLFGFGSSDAQVKSMKYTFSETVSERPRDGMFDMKQPC